MKELILILSLFQSDARKEGVTFPDSISIEYAVLGHDTLGRADHIDGHWSIKISPQVEGDILETVVYHELGHVAGLDHCKGRSIMNYNYLIPMTPAIKKRFLLQIKQFQKLCLAR